MKSKFAVLITKEEKIEMADQIGDSDSVKEKHRPIYIPNV